MLMGIIIFLVFFLMFYCFGRSDGDSRPEAAFSSIVVIAAVTIPVGIFAGIVAILAAILD